MMYPGMNSAVTAGVGVEEERLELLWELFPGVRVLVPRTPLSVGLPPSTLALAAAAAFNAADSAPGAMSCVAFVLAASAAESCARAPDPCAAAATVSLESDARPAAAWAAF